jgi:hypothetical protein
MKCARCHRSIKGATSWLMGHPFGPVCAKLMGVAPERKTASKTVRDEKTNDLFGEQDENLDYKVGVD